MRNWSRIALILLVFLAASAATYYYASADLPRRDHLNYMAERSFMETDWEWFWHSVSWSKIRYLQTGDAFLFRPLHMATLAIKDIFFRGNIFASGAVNIVMMALAGFSLYLFARRMTSAALAMALALLFMVQYAGIEIVAWGHISPYLMSLAFLGFALTAALKGTPRSLTLSGLLLFAGSLFHEFIVAGLVPAAIALLLVVFLRGRKGRIGEATLGHYLTRVFAIPLALYFCLNLLDYMMHMPSMTKADMVREGSEGLLGSLFSFPGAAAVAFLAPFKVHLTMNKILSWDFSSLKTPVLILGTGVVVAMLVAIAMNVRNQLRGKATATTMCALVAIFMLAGLVAGIGVGRVYMRDIEYIYDATYYYSIIAYVFCLLLAMGLSLITRSRISRPMKTIINRGALIVAVILIVVNFVQVRQTLAHTWPARAQHGIEALKYGNMLDEHSQRYCIAGSDNAVSLSTMSLQLWEHFCWPGDARRVVYLTHQRDGSLWFSEIRKHPLGPDTREVQLSPSGPYLLSRNFYSRPDMALRVERGFHGGIMLGHRGPGNSSMFMLRGPIVYPHKLKGGIPTDDVYLAVVPHLRPWSHVEVRHTWNGIYLFVDDYVLAGMASRGEEPGRTGIFIVQERHQSSEFSDFVAAPSRAGGSFEFVPVLRLADSVPEIPAAR